MIYIFKMSYSVILIAFTLLILLNSCSKNSDNSNGVLELRESYYIMKYKGIQFASLVDVIDTVYQWTGPMSAFEKYSDSSYSHYMGSMLSVKFFPSISAGNFDKAKSTTFLTQKGEYFLELKDLMYSPYNLFDYFATSGIFSISNVFVGKIKFYRLGESDNDMIVVNGKWNGVLYNKINNKSHNAEIIFYNSLFEK